MDYNSYDDKILNSLPEEYRDLARNLFKEKRKLKRTKAKDAAAFVIIFGGTSAMVTAAFALFVAEGLMTKGQSRAMQNHLRFSVGAWKGEAWRFYQETGDILGALNHSSRN